MQEKLEHTRTYVLWKKKSFVVVKISLSIPTKIFNLNWGKKTWQEKGDLYDPIYLSDMKFDDKYITEGKDPCLLDDHLLMDV